MTTSLSECRLTLGWSAGVWGASEAVGRLLVVSEALEARGDLLLCAALCCLLLELDAKAETQTAVVLIAVDRPLSHYHHVASRWGLSLQQLQSRGLLLCLDAFASLSQLEEPADDQQSLDRRLRLLQSRYSRPLHVVIDSLSLFSLQSAGGPRGLLCLLSRVRAASASLVLRLQADVPKLQGVLAVLNSSCTQRIAVTPLQTGGGGSGGVEAMVALTVRDAVLGCDVVQWRGAQARAQQGCRLLPIHQASV